MVKVKLSDKIGKRLNDRHVKIIIQIFLILTHPTQQRNAPMSLDVNFDDENGIQPERV